MENKLLSFTFQSTWISIQGKYYFYLLLFNGKCFSLVNSHVAAMPIKYSLFWGLNGAAILNKIPSHPLQFFLIPLNGVTQLNDIFILVATAAAAASGLSIIHS